MKTTHTISLMCAAALFIIPGCEVPGKVTGGGFMDGAKDGKANLGMNADGCDEGGAVSGNVNYHDKSSGVKVNGSVLDAGFCSPFLFSSNEQCSFCFTGEYEVFFSYDSTNPSNPGSGEGLICLRDDGEGGGDLDNAFVLLYSGPNSGYFNGDTGWQGNIQGHDCD